MEPDKLAHAIATSGRVVSLGSLRKSSLSLSCPACALLKPKTYLFEILSVSMVGVNAMLSRGVRSRVPYLVMFLLLLLGITLMGLFVSVTSSTPTTRSVHPTESTTTTQSTPMIQPEPTTIWIGATQSTSATQQAPETISGANFTVLPQEVVVNVSDTFFVSVFAENLTDMYGWQVRLCFDPAIVECINVSVPAQQVFSDSYPVSQALIDYNSTEFTKRPLQSVHNSEGYVLTGDCLLGQNQTTFYGSGFLCQVAFKALSSGSSSLTLSTSNIQSGQTCCSNSSGQTFCLDSEQEVTTLSVSNGVVTVLP